MISSRDAIVAILSQRFPLNAKQLSVLLRKQHGLSVSYQAVHKALKQLLGEGVLRKQKNNYQLSEAWIQKKKSEIGSIEAKYFQKAPDFGLPQENLVFNSMFEVDKFLIGSFVSIASNVRGELLLCLVWNHFWIPLFLSKKEYSQLADFAHKVKTFDISRGNTPIDKWCAKFWKKQGWETKCGLNVLTTADLAIFGDYTIQVFYPPEIARLVDKAYNETKNVSDLDVDYLFKQVFEKKARIPVIILKNADLAEQLRKQTKDYFKR